MGTREIYNSRNYVCLLDKVGSTHSGCIYNSRNYVCLLDEPRNRSLL